MEEGILWSAMEHNSASVASHSCTFINSIQQALKINLQTEKSSGYIDFVIEPCRLSLK